MTIVTRNAQAVRSNETTARQAEEVLRDVAFVLGLTQRVKADLLVDRPTRRSAANVSVRRTDSRCATA